MNLGSRKEGLCSSPRRWMPVGIAGLSAFRSLRKQSIEKDCITASIPHSTGLGHYREDGKVKRVEVHRGGCWMVGCKANCFSRCRTQTKSFSVSSLQYRGNTTCFIHTPARTPSSVILTRWKLNSTELNWPAGRQEMKFRCKEIGDMMDWR
jgi:hypothetical protein